MSAESQWLATLEAELWRIRAEKIDTAYHKWLRGLSIEGLDCWEVRIWAAKAVDGFFPRRGWEHE